jgi:hypothetical protein
MLTYAWASVWVGPAFPVRIKAHRVRQACGQKGAVVTKLEHNVKFLQPQSILPEPHKNLFGSHFNAGVFRAYLVTTSKILADRSGGDIGGAQEVEKIGAALVKRARAADQSKLSGTWKRKCENFGLLIRLATLAANSNWCCATTGTGER